MTEVNIPDILKFQQRANEIANELIRPALQPKSVRRFIRPMSFSKTKHGKFKIESETKLTWDVASLRHMIFLKVPHTKMTFRMPTTFHRLVKKGHGILTSDYPVEIYSQYIEFRKCKGHVLVGGLGLGMAAWMLLNQKNITSVTVVEKNQEIIELIAPQIPQSIKIIHDDLFSYLKNDCYGEKYDSAYHDIWYGTGESTWASDVVPLYRLSRQAGITGPLAAWGETEMRGQLISSLYMQARVDYIPSWKIYKVFVDAIHRKYGSNPTDEQLKQAIKLYITQIGSKRWEAMFEWDFSGKQTEQ